MLSRAGKSTDEKYAVFKKKDEILSGVNKKFVVKTGFLPPKKDPDQDYLERIKLVQGKKIMQTPTEQLLSPLDKSKAKRKSPRQPKEQIKGKWSSFRTISRGTYYKVNSVRNPPPPFGYYNINYDLVDKDSK